jgi:hypothetical protein
MWNEERTMIRQITWIGLVVLALVALTASPVLAQADTYTEIEQEPIASQLWNSCANEWVRLDGYLHILEHVTRTPDGATLYQLEVNPYNVFGEGLSSGIEYRFSGLVNELVKFPYPNPGATIFSWTEQHSFISQGDSQNLVMQETIRLILNDNGELTVDVYDVKLKCQ